MWRMPRLNASVVAPVVAVLVTVGFAYASGYGPFGHDPMGDVAGPRDSSQESKPPPAEKDEREPLPPAVNGVHTLFDDKWTVEEGQWSLGATADMYEAPPGTPEPSFTE